MSDSEEQSDLWLGRGEMADGVKLLWRENDLVFAREDVSMSGLPVQVLSRRGRIIILRATAR